MALITFMSDFGMVDHYVAVVKGSILSLNEGQQIIDITHNIKPYDISHGSFVLKETFRSFPEKTVHLVAVDSMRSQSPGIAIELEGHYFVGYDCGLLSLISKKKPDKIVEISLGNDTFSARNKLAEAAVKLAKGAALNDLGEEMPQMLELYGRQLKVTKREIAGNVMRVDGYGNLITNIEQKEFETICKINGEGVRYTVRFGREAFSQIHKYYADVDSGDCFLLFNSSGLLQIGINKGKASELLGLGIDAPINIEFTN